MVAKKIKPAKKRSRTLRNPKLTRFELLEDDALRLGLAIRTYSGDGAGTRYRFFRYTGPDRNLDYFGGRAEFTAQSYKEATIYLAGVKFGTSRR